MDAEFANYLLNLEKQIMADGELKDKYLLDIQYPMSIKLELGSSEDIDQNLRVNVWESEKKALKIGLHHQDDNTQHGILRVDFNSRHKNPVEVTSNVPVHFRPFAGIYLDGYNGHIHYVVDGYKPLAWAIPLEEDDFSIKSLSGRDDYADTLQAFFRKINLVTDVRFNTQLRVI